MGILMVGSVTENARYDGATASNEIQRVFVKVSGLPPKLTSVSEPKRDKFKLPTLPTFRKEDRTSSEARLTVRSMSVCNGIVFSLSKEIVNGDFVKPNVIK